MSNLLQTNSPGLLTTWHTNEQKGEKDMFFQEVLN